jgi:hypothetical protein
MKLLLGFIFFSIYSQTYACQTGWREHPVVQNYRKQVTDYLVSEGNTDIFIPRSTSLFSFKNRVGYFFFHGPI